MYFNYHAKAIRLIKEGHLVRFEVVENHNGISPCLILFFDNSKPMPIREHRFEFYFDLIKQIENSK